MLVEEFRHFIAVPRLWFPFVNQQIFPRSSGLSVVVCGDLDFIRVHCVIDFARWWRTGTNGGERLHQTGYAHWRKPGDMCRSMWSFVNLQRTVSSADKRAIGHQAFVDLECVFVRGFKLRPIGARNSEK